MFSHVMWKQAYYAFFIFILLFSIDADATRITGVHLVDVNTNAELGYLHNAAVIDLAVVPQINLSAIPNGNITKILFYVNGNFVRSEGVAPYAIGGDAAGIFNVWTHPGIGSHIIDVIPVNGIDTGEVHSVNIQIINSGSNNLYSLIEFTEPTCSNLSNGTASANGFGGNAPYSYAWSNGATSKQISNVSTGVYTVIVTDNSGNTSQTVCTVSNPQPISDNAIITNESCFGNDGSIELAMSGGTESYNINWLDGNFGLTRANLNAGTYSLSLTDYYGCSFSSSYTVGLNNTNAPFTVNETIITESCFGNDGSISITYIGGQGPYSVQWSNGATDDLISNLSQGNYTVTISDANSCSGDYTFLVPFDASLGSFTVIPTITNDACYSPGSGSISLGVSGGTAPYSYNWSNGANANPNSNLASGNYTVTITEQNGCSSINSFQVGFETSDPSINLNSTVQNLSCNNSEGSIVLNPTGGLAPYSYSWSIANTANCGDYLEQDSVVIIEAEDAVLSSHWSTQTTLPSYTGSSYIEWRSGDTTLAIINPGNGILSFVVNISNPGRYHVLARTSTPDVSEHNDCYIRFIDSDILLQQGANSFVSYGDTAIKLFQNTGTQDWTWQTKGSIDHIGGQIWTDFNSPGTYEFEIHGRSSLFKLDRLMLVHIDYDETIAMDTSNAPSPINDCNSNQLLGLSVGQYGLVMTDANGCETNAVYDVSDYEPITITSAINNPDCYLQNTGSGTVRVAVQGGNLPYSYAWSTSATDTLNFLENLPVGNYTITVSDKDNCTQTAFVELTGALPITVSDSIISATCKGISDG
ncbi:MAG: hypothetical protein HKO56_08195, partial [Bacteroidia bacterium]|nr:hypothetical protein [Bacteroidia bacterium]